MRIVRAPLRITLGGGGSDLGFGGRCITAAIQKYTYVAVNDIWDPEYSLHYSEVERVSAVDSIVHPIIRRALMHLETPPGVEITTMSDVPSQSGLGSSGSFTVALLHALDSTLPRHQLARLASQLDTGMQDQHAATYGGLRQWEFGQTITSQQIDIPPWFFGCALYDTGMRRDATTALRNPRPDAHTLLQQCADMRAGLSDPAKFADCLNAQWDAKYRAAPTAMHRYINHLIAELRRDGAWGCKLVGAGDGGMILTFSQDVVKSDLRRIPVMVDEEGVVTL